MKNILILGAGISGLSAAWFLRKQAKVTILERSNRIGGWISTQNKEGFLFEEGPRSFLSKGKGQATLQLIKDLELTSELIEASKSAKTRYIYHKGCLQPLNLPFLWKLKMLKLGIREWRLKSSGGHDESIGDFFERRFDKTIVSHLIDPMVKGIFGGNPYELSIEACFPRFQKWEQDYGSFLKGLFYSPKEPSTIYSFRNGMETLPKRLEERIDGEIILNTPCEKIHLLDNQIVVTTPTQSYAADHLIAAIPSRCLIPMLSKTSLPMIPHLTLTTVHLGFSQSLLKQKGFGYLVPSQENEAILGMTWDNQIFDRNKNQTNLCVMISGNPENAISIAQDALARHLGIERLPEVTHVHTAYEAIAQYPVGYKKQLLDFSHPRLTLLGPSYFGPGINDCIFEAGTLCLLHRQSNGNDKIFA